MFLERPAASLQGQMPRFFHILQLFYLAVVMTYHKQRPRCSHYWRIVGISMASFRAHTCPGYYKAGCRCHFEWELLSLQVPFNFLLCVCVCGIF